MGKREIDSARLQIILRRDLAERIDEIAEEVGISRSALCATILGYGVHGYDMALEIFAGALSDPEVKRRILGVESKKKK